jgi:hypothetical protein
MDVKQQAPHLEAQIKQLSLVFTEKWNREKSEMV